jgi:Tol biopolymer transport system component
MLMKVGRGVVWVGEESKRAPKSVSFEITSGSSRNWLQVKTDRAGDDIIWGLGKINDGGYKSMVFQADRDLNLQWIVGFDFPPSPRAFGVTPDGLQLFLSEEGSLTLTIYQMDAQTGSMLRILSWTFLEASTDIKITQFQIVQEYSSQVNWEKQS